jgi:hypothetical protein
MDLLLKSTAVPDRYLQAQGALPCFNLGFFWQIVSCYFLFRAGAFWSLEAKMEKASEQSRMKEQC